MSALPGSAQLDEHGIKRTLQDAIDRYPRLIALRATLRLPDPSTLSLEVLITRFQAVLLEKINAFIDSRQSEGKPAPPTKIRLLWGVEYGEHIPILLLLNQDTFYNVRHDPSLPSQIDTINTLISQAWSSVIDPPNELVKFLLSETLNCIQVARGDVEMYPSQYAALSNNALQLSSIVRAIR